MSWITTLSGQHFHFHQITAASIVTGDIATALSNLCRFTGQIPDFYSVAQHSALCSYLVPGELAFEALMHDAAEAYLGDVSSPLKALLPDYRKIEKQVDAVIRHKYGLPERQSPQVKQADMVMLATERRDFDIDSGVPWPCLAGIEPAGDVIHPLNPRQAHEVFIRRFRQLAPRAILQEETSL